MKFVLLTFLITSAQMLKGQKNIEEFKTDLQNLKTIGQVQDYLRKNAVKSNVISFNSEADTSDITKTFMSGKPGDCLTYEVDSSSTAVCKIFNVVESKKFRVQYIFLNGDKLSIKQIDSLRTIISEKLNSGSSFAELAKQYSMDGNAKKGGDLGWFGVGQMYKEFENAVKAHKQGEVFTLDIPEFKWSYVIKNSHPVKIEKDVIALCFEVKK